MLLLLGDPCFPSPSPEVRVAKLGFCQLVCSKSHWLRASCCSSWLSKRQGHGGEGEMSKQVSLPERTEERASRTCLPQPNDS